DADVASAYAAAAPGPGLPADRQHRAGWRLRVMRDNISLCGLIRIIREAVGNADRAVPRDRDRGRLHYAADRPRAAGQRPVVRSAVPAGPRRRTGRSRAHRRHVRRRAAAVEAAADRRPARLILTFLAHRDLGAVE